MSSSRRNLFGASSTLARNGLVAVLCAHADLALPKTGWKLPMLLLLLLLLLLLEREEEEEEEVAKGPACWGKVCLSGCEC